MKLIRDLSVTSYPHRRGTTPAVSLDFERQDYRRFGAPVALNAVLNVTRASSAVRVSETGVLETVGADVLRRDHVFGSGAFRGALFEGEATNLLQYSNDFTQVHWKGYATKPSFAGGQAAPDGSASAMTWNCADTVGGVGGKRGGILVPDSGPSGLATASVWLRASAPLTMRFGHSDATSQTIAVSTQWQRFTHTAALPNSQNRIFMLYEDVNDDIDVYIWGAQVEYGSSATTNIATHGNAIARSADLPGLTGISGTFDVAITYDDESTDTYIAETISEGWWPVLTRNRVKKITLK